MNLLVIDTATDKSQVIWAQDFKVIEVVQLEKAQFVFEVLESFDVDFQAIAVVTGPGSYTGIRVGMAAAMGLSSALQVPVVGLSSLEGLISHEMKRFLSLIDARGGGAYILPQRWEAGEVVLVGEVKKIPIEEMPMYLHAVEGVVGPQLRRFSLLKCDERGCDPSHLVRLAERELAKHTTLVMNAKPCYTV